MPSTCAEAGQSIDEIKNEWNKVRVSLVLQLYAAHTYVLIGKFTPKSCIYYVRHSSTRAWHDHYESRTFNVNSNESVFFSWSIQYMPLATLKTTSPAIIITWSHIRFKIRKQNTIQYVKSRDNYVPSFAVLVAIATLANGVFVILRPYFYFL